MSVQLSILVGNNDALMSMGYSRVEIWASSDQGATYNEITSSSSTSAVLVSKAAQTQFRMGGVLLKISVDGGPEQSIAFDSLIFFWTPAQVAARINQVIPGLASVSGLSVVLTSPTIGRISSLAITSNQAPTLDFGLCTGTVASGQDARPTMIAGQLLYQFTDIPGSTSNRYKWRFSANGSPPFSDFSAPVYGSTPALIDVLNLSVLTARFVDFEGRPKKARIIVTLDNAGPQALFGYAVGGTETKVYESDEQGFLAVSLVRGAALRIAVEGTPLVRNIVVPSTPSFDLLTTLAAANDSFTVQQAPALLTRMGI